MATLLDGKLREDAKSERPTLACDAPSQILKLGASPDFARCKGTRKDGKPCTMHVNKSTSEYCAFHASAVWLNTATSHNHVILQSKEHGAIDDSQCGPCIDQSSDTRE